ncbi:MAG: TIGR00725 family protein [bacterium (Candidatus Stahlbacteria) CG23_combo_of_CG06-09_8_20_14_all_34_7]|nr:MAG: TIGR00725 family protein [bacterium (Candidatus Stahlbacteria) CG23_combo_of_CG06-09_8_20_14_all_34_7]
MYKLIGIIGGSKTSPDIYDEAVSIGKALAIFNLPIICGGGNGIMEAVSKGMKIRGGLTIGILPFDRSGANEFIDIPISTGIGFARNAVIVNSADVIIAIDGKFGTLSELGFALQFDKPIIAYKCVHAKHLNLRIANNVNEIIDFIKENI